jgi:pimeloyl-ACP methyl ester carboxylesterase
MLPVLLVPGLNCTSRVYRDAIEALWSLGSVMVANHCDGEGLTGIAANILAAAPPRFALAGFSFGGYLAFEILRQARDRVERLALLDTSARADTAEAAETRTRRIALAESGKFSLVVQQSFAASVHPDHLDDAKLLAIHSGMALANGPMIYARQQRAIIERPDSRSALSRIDVPTLVLVGEGDQITPPEIAREMHEAIPGSNLMVVPGAGHMALIEQPATVSAALADWARP